MKQNKKDGVAKLISFAAIGTIDYQSYDSSCRNCHISGTPSDPDQFIKPYHWWADEKDVMSTHWDSLDIPDEGVPVLDKRAAIETNDGYRWVFKGPILDCRLPDGEISRLGEVSPIMLPAIVAYGMVGALVENKKAAQSNHAGPLDYVSVSEYIQGWKEHGAKVGVFKLDSNGNGYITWDN